MSCSCCCSCNRCCTGCCCDQKTAPLTRRQRFLPRTSNPCIRPCCVPRCVDTYSGCRAFRPKYCCISKTAVTGCGPQIPRCRGCSCCCLSCC